MDSNPRITYLLYPISIFIFIVIAASTLALIISNFSHGTAPYPGIQHSSSAKVGFGVQDLTTISNKPEGKKITGKNEDAGAMQMSRTIRRLLGGPGSSPPKCTAKCGQCSPCKPVHVPVPPGKPVTTEYYPEAWRCKCGNKLYMP